MTSSNQLKLVVSKKESLVTDNTRYVRYRGRIYSFRGIFGDMGGIKMNGRTEYKPLRLMRKCLI
jgi:hypothetical protein